MFSFFILVVGYILSFRTVRRSGWIPVIGIFVLLRIMLTTEFMASGKIYFFSAFPTNL